MMTDLLCRSYRRIETIINSNRLSKIVWQVIQKLHYDIITIIQWHQKVFWLRKKHTLSVGNCHHLRLPQSSPQVEKVNRTIISNETHSGSILTHHSLFLDNRLDSVDCGQQILGVYSLFRDIKHEDEGWWHRWSIHVLV